MDNRYIRRQMRMVTLLFLAAAFSTNARATVPAKSTAYYYGEGRILDLRSGAGSAEETLVLRVVDPPNGHLVEVVCKRDPGTPATLSATYVSVDGSTLVLTDQPDYSQSGKLKGTGQVSGTPWLWNYLQFSIQYYFTSAPGAPGSFMQIDDVNYLVANQLIARKQLYLHSNAQIIPFELWDAELDLISTQDYQSHAKAMNCPPFPSP